MDAIALLEDQIEKYSQGIRTLVSVFDARSAIDGWWYILRGTEELINIPNEDPTVLLRDFLNTPLSAIIANLMLLHVAGISVQRRFDSNVAHRFKFVVLLFANFQISLVAAKRYEAAEMLSTVDGLITFLRSRRRHMVALLYTLPEVCQGHQRFNPNEDAARLLQAVEHGVDLTGLHQKAMLAEVFPDFQLTIESGKLIGSYSYQPLNALFLDAERTSVVDMGKVAREAVSAVELEQQDRSKIFSCVELRNQIIIMTAAYGEFNLDKTLFGPMAKMTNKLLSFCQDDYYVNVDIEVLIDMLRNFGIPEKTWNLFLHVGADYTVNTNEFAPFIQIGKDCRSTVPLMGRFLNQLKNFCLNKNRRYQIRSGYIFEEEVRGALTEQGFFVKDIRRINRQEFDVIAVRNSVIFNVQCKNNLVDQTRMESERKVFARYNRRLEKYYERALEKERMRADLLRRELGLNEVRHFVVSAFPVATTNPRILAFANIADFSTLATMPEI